MFIIDIKTDPEHFIITNIDTRQVFFVSKKCNKLEDVKALIKQENIKDAFSYDHPEDIDGKKILLLDDIYDSGATMKEIGRLLTSMGAELIVPIAIAKTVGGDIL